MTEAHPLLVFAGKDRFLNQDYSIQSTDVILAEQHKSLRYMLLICELQICLIVNKS